MEKRFLLPTMLLLLCICCCNVFAKTVPVTTASTVALNFYKQLPNSQNSASISAVLNYTSTEADGSVDFYVFNITPVKGFVIVSADDNAKPVIGYSTESYFNSTLSNVQSWMTSTASKIRYIVTQNISADANINLLWNCYQKGVQPPSTRGSGAGPLVSTTWNQEPVYNNLCPYNNNDQERAVTGCVATAMAQIMKYWNYPVQGKGSYTYDAVNGVDGYDYLTQSADFGTTTYAWTSMPANLTSGSPSVDITAVATLCYQCGVSVAMQYGDDNEDGSGAYVLMSESPLPKGISAQYAYKTYFSYNPNTLTGVHFTDYSVANWQSLLENEINNNRPVQYEGTDVNGLGGHTWVCDGYDANDNLHMNWGWGGASNGFYDVSALNPTGQPYQFNTGDAALIGIEPLSGVNVTAQALQPSLCNGDTTQITAVGPASATYSWTPTAGLSCASCAITKAYPAANTIYTVTADSAGVKGSYSVTVNVTTAVITSFTAPVTSSCSFPASINFTNKSTNATSYLWNFGDGDTSSAVSPTHIYNTYGDFTVTLQATGPCGVSSSSKNNLIQVNDIDPVPVASNVTVCNGESATVSATSSGGTLTWYEASTGEPSIGSGSSYITAPLYFGATYYVESDITKPMVSCPPSSYDFGTGSFFTNTATTHSIIFNCTTPQTLVSADVDASSAGDRIITLTDSNGTTLQSMTVNVPTGASTVTLNFSLPAENNLSLSVQAGTVDLYRNNSGATYPYYSSDSTVILTASDVANDGYPNIYYYYFYNWKLQQTGCTSNRVPVQVNVFGSGDSFSDNVSTNNVTFTPSNANAGTYTWSFGDGTTSSKMSPTHTYANSGKYSVKLVETNGTCYDSITQSVNIIATGIADVKNVGSISLMPNPASTNLQVQINSQQEGDNYVISVYNILGETMLTKNVNLVTGSNTINMDVSVFTPGVYFMRLTEKGGVTETRKFVKQ